MPANGTRGRRERLERADLLEVGGGGSSKDGKTRGKSKQLGTKKPPVVTERLLEVERVNLIAEKQAQLEAVVDNHDTLVREMFHLDFFLNMLDYDPSEAKKDNTRVFQDYKATKFDLVDKAIPGPSRSTRRGRMEQVKSLTVSSVSAPLPSPASAPPKKALKSKTAHVVSNIPVKTKGKGRAMDIPVGNGNISVFDDSEAEESISAILIHRKPTGKAEGVNEAIPGAPSSRKRKFESEAADFISAPISNRRSGRLKGPTCDALAGDATEHPDPPTQATAPPTLNQRRHRKESSAVTIFSPLMTPKFNIKRVKLLVRRPPFPITNPRQRPPPPMHNSSVGAFLTSYFSLGDQDIDEYAVQGRLKADAEILERANRLRKRGVVFPVSETSLDIDLENFNTSLTPKRLSKDHWDHVIDVACHAGKVWTKRNTGQQIAGQTAKLIRAYWDNQEAMKERLKVQEERRLRTLAKATIRLVTDEWKKAVFYIREQERLELEAEQLQRQREHLDAILDQSGHLLETQQGDLSRGNMPRSRSSSMSLTYQGWASEAEEEEGEDEDEDEENEESDQDSNGEPTRDMEATGGGKKRVLTAGLQTEGSDEDMNHSYPHDSDPEEGNLSDTEDDGHTRMLLDDSDHVQTPTSVHSSIIEDTIEKLVTDVPDLDAGVSDGESQSDGSSLIAVDDLINAPADSSSQRLPRPTLPTTIYSTTEAICIVSKPFLPVKSTTPPIPDSDIPTSPSHRTSLERSTLGTQVLETAGVGDSFPLRQPNIDQQISSSAPPSTPPVNTSSLVYNSRPSPQLKSASIGRSDIDNSEVIPSGSPKLVPNDSYSHPSSNLATPIASSSDPTPPPNSEVNGEATSSLTKESTEPAEKLNAEVHDTDHEVSTTPQPQEEETALPDYLKPFAVAPVDWDSHGKVVPPLLLRGVLRPYQQSGLEWLASLHTNNLNGILADEMGLGKTIQTIALLAHLACDRGIWGPHLIVVPTSVLLNWEMEFKKFLPGFKVMSYHGSMKRRKELRQGWNDKHHFNVCVTSYTLASRDAHIFKRKAWYYMILDEAHMIKNFKSQRWNILLMFRSFRRLLLTGTPLQNNLTELWALLQFLMSGANFASLKDFGDWFSNPVEKAIEMGNADDDDTMQRVAKLHTVLRPYLLRRLKRDVEKELPSKYEHLVICPLSKRQRFLYDEFMARAHTRDALQSGVYQKIANVLMQLRKVCNHPDLFEVRPIVTSFAMERSAIADFEIKELLIRRRLANNSGDMLNLGLLGLRFIDNEDSPIIVACETRRLDATSLLPYANEQLDEPPPKDLRTITGFRKYSAYLERAATVARWSHIGYLNRLRCNISPLYSSEMLSLLRRCYQPLIPNSSFEGQRPNWEATRVVNSMVKSYDTRAGELASVVDRFSFVTPAVVALELPRFALPGCQADLYKQLITFDDVLHRASVKLQIAFPDPSLLQYDCGKLQELTRLLREKKAGGHRVLIFTQMTKILDILEIFLNFHGYLYLRLDGATKIEDRQYITERFNADSRVFCFIASSRSGGVGINLTGADTVVFYDSDFNPQMDRQCEDRAHRIGQIRDVHIYRFVSQHTVEEALLRKANQKRSLDDLVIQKGEFDWRSLFNDESALSKALEEFEDTEDVHAAAVAATEEVVMQGADEADFGGDQGDPLLNIGSQETPEGPTPPPLSACVFTDEPEPQNDVEEGEEPVGRSTAEYLIEFVRDDPEFFKEWRL